jgi:hypothetical protein
MRACPALRDAAQRRVGRGERCPQQLARGHLFGEWFDLRDFEVDQWLARREADDQINALYDRYLAAAGKTPFSSPLIMGDG